MVEQKENKEMKNNNISEKVVIRNRFFYTSYRKVLVIFIMSLIMLVISLLSTWYIYTKKSPPYYIPITKDRRVLPLDSTAFADEKYTQKAVRHSWETVKLLNTFDYLNFQTQLLSVNTKFTPRGWDSYYETLKKSNNMVSIVEKHMISSITPDGVPKVVASGVVNGFYKWDIAFPVILKYVDTLQTTKDREVAIKSDSIITVSVTRVPNTVDADGVLIEKMIIQEVKK